MRKATSELNPREQEVGASVTLKNYQDLAELKCQSCEQDAEELGRGCHEEIKFQPRGSNRSLKTTGSH